MLRLVESKEEKMDAQLKLETLLRAAIPSCGYLPVGYQGGLQEMELFSRGRPQDMWCGFAEDITSATTRRWNAFGFFDPSYSAQEITVEVNIPTDSNTERVGGFFAKDEVTGNLCLMHTGKIGGGRKGIGKKSFLAWKVPEPVRVVNLEGRTRVGMLIGPLDRTIVRHIERFARDVEAFKHFVSEGKDKKRIFQNKIAQVDRYWSEFSGRKTGRRGSLIDYISHHGDVVDELYRNRCTSKVRGEVVAKSILIDLYVKKGQQFSEIYEVKTSATRSDLYSAIGQLSVHSVGAKDVRKILVIPQKEKMPADIEAAVRNLGIKVLKYARSANGQITLD